MIIVIASNSITTSNKLVVIIVIAAIKPDMVEALLQGGAEHRRHGSPREGILRYSVLHYYNCYYH